jgi:hypothetical protein
VTGRVYNWSQVDLSRGTSDIARELGCTPKTVLRARARLASGRASPSDVPVIRDWSGADWSAPAREIAEKFGASLKTVYAARRRRGWAAPARFGKVVGQVGVDWTAVEWRHSDHYLAGWLDVPVDIIRDARAIYGRPVGSES